MNEVRIDMAPYVAAITRVLVEPYQTFIEKLRADGRLTLEEVEALRKEILERGEQLPELVQAELNKSVDSAG